MVTKMKKDSLAIDGKIYLSSRRAAEIAGYSKDYVGQLCRSGKLVCRSIGRLWYVDEVSLRKHQAESFKANQTSFRPADFVQGSAPITKPISSSSLIEAVRGVSSPDLVPEKASKQASRNMATIYLSKLVFVSTAVMALVVAGGITTNTVGKSLLSRTISRYIADDSTRVNHSIDATGKKLNSYLDMAYSYVSPAIPKISPTKQSDLLALSASTNVPGEGDDYSLPHAGLVVVPKPASAANNASETKLAETITNSFSDNVTIKPGPNGTTGVITPEFRTIKGHDFLYVLVPVKASSSLSTSTPKN